MCTNLANFFGHLVVMMNPAGLAAQAAELGATVQRHGAHRWQVPKLGGAQKGLEAER